jgi:hypothetical protein
MTYLLRRFWAALALLADQDNNIAASVTPERQRRAPHGYARVRIYEQRPFLQSGWSYQTVVGHKLVPRNLPNCTCPHCCSPTTPAT